MSKVCSVQSFCVALAFSLVATAGAAPGDLYVAENQKGVVLKFSPDGTQSTFVSDVAYPGGLAFDRAGNLFVSAGSDILKFAPDGTRTGDRFVADLYSPSALAFDGAGNLFAGYKASGDVGILEKLMPSGEQISFAVDRATYLALAFDTSGNLLATLQDSLDGKKSIVSFAPDGTRHRLQFSGGASMAFDKAGNLYVTSDDFTQILKYTPAGEQSVFASGFSFVGSLAFDRDGNLFAVDSGSIYKLRPDGTRSIFASGFSRFDWISIAFEPVTEKLRNLSARGFVAGGDNTLIGGFIVGGSALANNAVVIRAIGPSLAGAGVSDPLPDPVIDLHDGSGAIIASNNNWQDTQKAQIVRTGLAPSNPRESAIFATLPAGNYTAVVRNADDATGNALVEIYSITQ